MGTFIVEYDYIAKSKDELTIRKGDIITNATPAEDGWLIGECQGTRGHFPENFVTPLTREKAKNRTLTNELNARLQSVVNGNHQMNNKTGTLRKRPTNDENLFQSNHQGSLFQVKVAYQYTPVHDDELDIKPNDIIQVTRLVEEGWYEGILGDKKGLFPSNYVTRISDEASTKKEPSNKRKPSNGLGALIQKSVSPTSMETPTSQSKTPTTPPILTAKKNTPIKARVLFDYKKAADDELTLTANEIVTILDKNVEDEGWWRGELNGRIGVFPDNYVEEIPATNTLPTNAKHRPNTPDTNKPNTSLAKTTAIDNHKGTSFSDEEGHPARNHYAEINNLDAIGTTEKLGGFNKPKPVSTKRPPSSIMRKPENGFNKTTGSIDETSTTPRSNNFDAKNERKLHTPSPPSSQREPGQLESPRYNNNRPSSLHSTLSTTNPTFNGTTEIISTTATNSSYVNANHINSSPTLTLEQLQKDLMKMKDTMDQMKMKFTDQIRELVDELDQEKKNRAMLQIELERLQKQIQKSSLVH